MNSTLALQKSDYEAEVGEFMGRGRGLGTANDPAWSSEDDTKIKFDVKSGLRRFYWPGHVWSFLKPFATLTLTSGESSVELPDDFGGVDQGARCLVIDPDGNGVMTLTFCGPQSVEAAIVGNTGSTGLPVMIAQRPQKEMANGKMQRSELIVFPEADQTYTLKFPYFITPNYLLDVTQPFAYGGVEHHETILECCLAVAELRRDNILGVHSAESQRLLQRSVEMDRLKQPKRLGMNLDYSDHVDYDPLNTRGWTPGGGVTINGTLYT
jgi:hypothetical protein